VPARLEQPHDAVADQKQSAAFEQPSSYWIWFHKTLEWESEPPELLPVGDGEAFENLPPARAQAEIDLPGVLRAVLAQEELLRDQTVDEADCAVMRDLQPLGELADIDLITAREAHDGEESLVLLGGEADLAGSLLTEAQEEAETVAECGELFILRLRHPRGRPARGAFGGGGASHDFEDAKLICIVIRYNRGCDDAKTEQGPG